MSKVWYSNELTDSLYLRLFFAGNEFRVNKTIISVETHLLCNTSLTNIQSNLLATNGLDFFRVKLFSSG